MIQLVYLLFECGGTGSGGWGECGGFLSEVNGSSLKGGLEERWERRDGTVGFCGGPEWGKGFWRQWGYIWGRLEGRGQGHCKGEGERERMSVKDSEGTAGGADRGKGVREDPKAGRRHTRDSFTKGNGCSTRSQLYDFMRFRTHLESRKVFM